MASLVSGRLSKLLREETSNYRFLDPIKNRPNGRAMDTGGDEGIEKVACIWMCRAWRELDSGKTLWRTVSPDLPPWNIIMRVRTPTRQPMANLQGGNVPGLLENHSAHLVCDSKSRWEIRSRC
ncbi:hypothetical protein KM043_014221 [Ampulex compressa]|nr:hypothetical protein KM043_014221 [Ampulex compressa]